MSTPTASSAQQTPAAPPPDGAERRSYFQILSNANRQVWSRVVVAVLFLLPVVALFAAHLLYTVMQEISSARFEDPSMALHLVHELRSVGFLFFSVILLLCLLGIYFLFFLTVRVYGPQVALLRFIEQLKQGNYERYRSLRRDDQLKEIWQALQDLAAALKRKHG